MYDCCCCSGKGEHLFVFSRVQSLKYEVALTHVGIDLLAQRGMVPQPAQAPGQGTLRTVADTSHNKDLT